MNREQFFSKIINISQKPIPLDLPELGEKVYIKQLTAKEREEYEDKLQETEKHEVRATVASLCVCNEDGELVFTGEGDVKRLNDAPSKVLMKIFAKFNELNGIGAEEVKEIEKK